MGYLVFLLFCAAHAQFIKYGAARRNERLVAIWLSRIPYPWIWGVVQCSDGNATDATDVADSLKWHNRMKRAGGALLQRGSLHFFV